MLRLRKERAPSKNYILVELETDQAIPLSYEVAVEIKKAGRTCPALSAKLCAYFRDVDKYKEILDRNLCFSMAGLSSQNAIKVQSEIRGRNVQQLFDDFEPQVQ